MKKKGYFFILDAFLALSVLVVGIVVMMGTSTIVPESSQTVNFADDTLKFLSNTKIKNYNNEYFGINGIYVKNGTIKDTEKSLLQQVGEFYYYNNIGDIKTLLQNSTKSIMPPQYRYEILIQDIRVYPNNPTQQYLDSKDESEVLFPAKTLAFGRINLTTDLFGPYKVEVFVWQ